MKSIFNICARALARTLISRLRPLVELLLVFVPVRCGDYWCKIGGADACTLLKISNSPLSIIPFPSYLFVLVFVSFFSGLEVHIHIFWFCNVMLSNPIIERTIHAESVHTEFFYQSSTRYLSDERSDFPHPARHVEK